MIEEYPIDDGKIETLDKKEYDLVIEPYGIFTLEIGILPDGVIYKSGIVGFSGYSPVISYRGFVTKFPLSYNVREILGFNYFWINGHSIEEVFNLAKKFYGEGDRSIILNPTR